MNDEKRYAVVTGGTRGIGRAVSERLLREGYNVIAVYAKNDKAAEEMVRSNIEYSKNLFLIKQDLCGYDSALSVRGGVLKLCNKIDVLICNSGTTDFTDFEHISPENWMHVMNVNLNGPFFLIQQLSSVMRDNAGRIILIGSNVGTYPHGRSVCYCVSKAGVHSLARNLVKVFSSRGITVNCVVPGTTDTSWHDEKTPEHKQRIMDKIALHRFGRPEEIAELCTEIIRNQFINGALLAIDGGYDYK